MFETLGESEFVEVVDWKMKWLMFLLRETQVDFFGKADTCWHGCMYVMTEPSDRTRLRTWYVHCVSDDKKEDSFHSMSCVESCQLDFVNHVWCPEVAAGTPCFYYAISDGAGCYAGLHQLLAHIDLSLKTRVYIKAHYIPEAGFNKTALDGRFTTDGKVCVFVCGWVHECVCGWVVSGP